MSTRRIVSSRVETVSRPLEIVKCRPGQGTIARAALQTSFLLDSVWFFRLRVSRLSVNWFGDHVGDIFQGGLGLAGVTQETVGEAKDLGTKQDVQSKGSMK